MKRNGLVLLFVLIAPMILLAAGRFSSSEAKEAVRHFVDGQKNAGGELLLVDRDRNGQQLLLKFVQISPSLQRLAGGGFLVCADFQLVDGAPAQIYDLDFWVYPDAEGKLAVREYKVHKDPARVEGRWEQKPRYTYVDHQPISLGVVQ